MRGLLDRLFAPEWAGGWALARVLFAVVAILTHGPRLWQIEDVFAAADMVFSVAPFHFTDRWILTPPTARLIWATSIAGALVALWGGRLAKLGVAVFLAGSWVFLAIEGLNTKAYDRLLTWIGFGLLLGPIGERGLGNKARSPAGRWFLLLVYCALYGSTGWHKILLEPGWWNGEVLAYHLVHRYFGMKALGVWISGHPLLYMPASWFTLAFEGLFPLVVWFRRLNPWILLGGAMMHLGILLLMDVGPFSYVAVAAYPVLLHPEVARAWWGRALGRWPALARISPP